MKKPLIYTLAISALVISTGLTAVFSSFATTEQKPTSNLIATDTDPTNTQATTDFNKSENVYIITNSDGSVNKTFINNTINTSSEPLPLAASVTYSLDGNEIKGEDLIGQSGHVKITFHFTATKSYQNKLIPFLTVTSLSLDSAKFTNINLDHGKIISESSNILLAGYTFPGLNADLSTDFLPDSFTITADVTNFELPNTYTFATNELFTEIDTTKLTSIDSVVNSINDLGAAFDKILAGSSELAKGSTDLNLGAQKLAAGISKLNDGANQLAAGINLLDVKVTEFTPKLQSLATGLSTLSTKSTAINQGVQAAFTGLFNSLQQQIATTTDPQTAAAISNIITQYSSDVLPTLYESLGTYTGTVDYIASSTANLDTAELTNGVSALKSASSELAVGSDQLTIGASDLANGADQLATGMSTLNSGLAAFKEQGLNKLINFANHDLASFTANLRSTVNAANSYHHYNNPSATSTKFIFKTPSLK